MTVTVNYYSVGTADSPDCSGTPVETFTLPTKGCNKTIPVADNFEFNLPVGFDCTERMITENTPILGCTSWNSTVFPANKCTYVSEGGFTGSVEISECTSDGLSSGAIVGIAVGSIVGLILIYYLYKKFGSNSMSTNPLPSRNGKV